MSTEEVKAEKKKEGPADWVAQNVRHELSDSERALVELVCAAFRTGAWNLKWTSLRRSSTGATVSTERDLATFDGDALTRLVILAHDRCMRVSIGSSSPRHVTIGAWPRVREGSMMHRHPTMEDALAALRAEYPVHATAV